MSNVIAITMGDPAGIGPEIIAKSFRDSPRVMTDCFVAGDVATLRRAAGCLQVGRTEEAGAPKLSSVLPVAWIDSPLDLARVPPRCIPVLQVPDGSEPRSGRGVCTRPVPWGKVSAQGGRMGGQAVVWAAQAVLRGEVAALVTAPLHKEALALAGWPFNQFPGHTELLQSEAAAFQGRAIADLPVRMMLANDELRTVLVSIHLSLREAIRAVTFDAVLQTLQVTHQALHKTLGRAPRIGVAGLNPHAGEGGLFGREEIDIIEPAISAARAQGMQVRPICPGHRVHAGTGSARTRRRV